MDPGNVEGWDDSLPYTLLKRKHHYARYLETGTTYLAALNEDQNSIRASPSSSFVQTSPYEVLDYERREIRLLCINGETGAERPLNFTLLTISLADPDNLPRYDAISYCWGSSDRNSSILVDGNVLAIPERAFWALQWICVRHKRTVVWIDSVCIDQSNITERNQQVSIMGEVYSKAAVVFVWFGGDAEFAAPGMRTAVEVVNMLDMEIPNWRSDPQHPFANASIDVFQQVRPVPAHLDIDSLCTIFRIDWFTRVWVIQEVCLNRAKDTYFICGSNMIQWAVLGPAASYMLNKSWSRAWDIPEKYHEGLRKATRIWLYSGSRWQLLPLLRTFSNLGCSDFRDRVYSLLGMRWSRAQQSKSASYVAVDYTECAVNVFANATKAAILETNALFPLQIAWRLSELKKFPSWAIPVGKFGISGERTIRPPNPPAMPADGLCSVRLRPTDSPRVLSLVGYFMDTVKCISPHTLFGSSDLEVLAMGMLQMFMWWVSNAHTMLSKSMLRPLFAIAMMAGEDYFGNDMISFAELGDRVLEALDCLLDDTESVLAHLKDKGDPVQRSCSLSPNGRDSSQDHNPAENIRRQRARSVAPYRRGRRRKNSKKERLELEVARMLQQMHKVAETRTLFVTKWGSVGLGPINSEPGDVVTILSGGSVPFILRPREAHFHLVGDAYVQSFRNGKWLNRASARWIDLH